jgi:hypothetical protein
MRNLYTVGIAQVLYALGANEFFQQVVFVEIKDFNPAPSASRSLKTSIEITRDICGALNKQFKTLSIDEISESKDDLVDVAVFTRANREVFTNSHLLAVQIEHVNIVRPSILRLFSGSFRKRMDFLNRIIIPFRVRKFYSLAKKPKRGIFLKELELDWNEIRAKEKEILNHLRTLRKYDFLRDLELWQMDPVLIVLPMASHFGGNLRYNNQIFHYANELATELGIRKILIKNHPSDSTNYLKEYSLNFNFEKFEIKNLCNELERTLPLELLVHVFSNFMFVAGESTAIYTTRDLQVHSPHILEFVGRRSKWSESYDRGEMRSLMDHVYVRL